MCGIAGLFKALPNINDAEQQAVQRMVHQQRHRGPDDEGIVMPCSQIIFGHRRLSIIDLSAIAKNPMCNEDQKIWLIFNGEIYNFQALRQDLSNAGHTFKSKADSEVILHGYEEWGIEKLLHSLRGMFAFALCDTRNSSNSQVFLARDRFGIKPLYYYFCSELLVFASEVNALLASGIIKSEIAMESLVGFLMLGSIPAPLTYQKNITSLLPAEYLQITSRNSTVQIEPHRYWRLPVCGSNKIPDSASKNISEINHHIESLLQESIRLHLVSDVPVGVFLSGGLDSSALTALASPYVEEPLRTLTITFDETDYNEAPYARMVAEKFHTHHTEININGAMFIEEIPAILKAMDQPSNDGVNTYFISKAARQADLTVLLSGLGGDELFLGYPYYSSIHAHKRALLAFAKSPAYLRKILSGLLRTYGNLRGRPSYKRFSYVKEMNIFSLYRAIRGFFTPQEIISLLNISESEFILYSNLLLEHLNNAVNMNELSMNNPVDSINSLDYHFYLNNQLLRDSDFMSMTHSIELRVPYLDHMLVEYVKQLPVEDKIQPGLTKSLLVAAIKNQLPQEILTRKKWGFIFPFSHWLKNNTHALRTYLFPCSLLNTNAVNSILNEFISGSAHWSKPWCLAVLNSKMH